MSTSRFQPGVQIDCLVNTGPERRRSKVVVGERANHASFLSVCLSLPLVDLTVVWLSCAG